MAKSWRNWISAIGIVIMFALLIVIYGQVKSFQ